MPTLSTKDKQMQRMIKQRKQQISKILDYAETRYGVGVQGNDTLLNQLVQLSLNRNRNPTNRTVDGIIKEWSFWEPYVSEDSFSKFFAYQLKSMYHNHAAATSSSVELRSYIGNKAKIQHELPFRYGTSVSLNGTCLLNGKPI